MLSTDVVVVGAGYAGCYAIAELRRQRIPVIAVDPTGRLDMLPRLASVAGHADPAGDAAIELNDLFPDLIVVKDKMTGLERGVITTANGHRIRGRVTIITAGAEPASPPIKGLRNAFPLRTAADALRLRAQIAESNDVLIIGGGATGCQLAGAISASGVSSATLVDGEARLMAGFAECLGEHARSILTERGVRVELECPVKEIQKGAVVLADGTELAGLPVWAGGFTATMDSFSIGPTTDGRLDIAPTLLVAGATKVLAAGDVAAHRDRNGDLLPMAAQTAVQAGTGAAKNAARLMRGERLASISMRDLGWVVDLSAGRGVAEVGPLKIAGPLLDRIPPYLHDIIDKKTLYELGGVKAVKRFRSGHQNEIPPGFDMDAIQQYLA